MVDALLGKKIGMTQIFGDKGQAIPVTVLEAGPCVVVGVRTVEKDGYNAVQLGYGIKRKPNKPTEGVFKAAKTKPARWIRERRVKEASTLKAGDEVKANIFDGVKYVDVIGISKGRGFQGMVKRYHKHRGPESHGSMQMRAPGSIGSNTSPARVLKGKKMPGHMGVDRITVQNIPLVRLDAEKNLMFLNGAVPGPPGNVVMIQKSRRQ